MSGVLNDILDAFHKLNVPSCGFGGSPGFELTPGRIRMRYNSYGNSGGSYCSESEPYTNPFPRETIEAFFEDLCDSLGLPRGEFVGRWTRKMKENVVDRESDNDHYNNHSVYMTHEVAIIGDIRVHKENEGFTGSLAEKELLRRVSKLEDRINGMGELSVSTPLISEGGWNPHLVRADISVLALLRAIYSNNSVLITVPVVECPSFRFYSHTGRFSPWCVKKNKGDGGECVPDPSNCSVRIMAGRTVHRAIDMITSDRVKFWENCRKRKK